MKHVVATKSFVGKIMSLLFTPKAYAGNFTYLLLTSTSSPRKITVLQIIVTVQKITQKVTVTHYPKNYTLWTYLVPWQAPLIFIYLD